MSVPPVLPTVASSFVSTLLALTLVGAMQGIILLQMEGLALVSLILITFTSHACTHT